jgi:hypothetical protein
MARTQGEAGITPLVPGASHCVETGKASSARRGERHQPVITHSAHATVRRVHESAVEGACTVCEPWTRHVLELVVRVALGGDAQQLVHVLNAAPAQHVGRLLAHARVLRDGLDRPILAALGLRLAAPPPKLGSEVGRHFFRKIP